MDAPSRQSANGALDQRLILIPALFTFRSTQLLDMTEVDFGDLVQPDDRQGTLTHILTLFRFYSSQTKDKMEVDPDSFGDLIQPDDRPDRSSSHAVSSLVKSESHPGSFQHVHPLICSLISYKLRKQTQRYLQPVITHVSINQPPPRRCPSHCSRHLNSMDLSLLASVIMHASTSQPRPRRWPSLYSHHLILTDLSLLEPMIFHDSTHQP